MTLVAGANLSYMLYSYSAQLSSSQKGSSSKRQNSQMGGRGGGDKHHRHNSTKLAQLPCKRGQAHHCAQHGSKVATVSQLIHLLYSNGAMTVQMKAVHCTTLCCSPFVTNSLSTHTAPALPPLLIPHVLSSFLMLVCLCKAFHCPPPPPPPSPPLN